MKENRRMWRVLTIIAALAIAITSYMFIIEKVTTNPDLEKHAGARETLDQLYTEFIQTDHVNETMKELFLSKDIHRIVLFRTYYGDPQTYRIKKIKDLSSAMKEAKVSVETMLSENKKRTVTDTVTLMNFGEHWLIIDYYSTNTENWPELP